jgi:hypothetical protein
MPRPLVHLVNFNSPQWLSEPKGTELAQGKVTIADDKDPICIYCVGRRGETDIHSGCITEPGVVLYCSRFQFATVGSFLSYLSHYCRTQPRQKAEKHGVDVGFNVCTLKASHHDASSRVSGPTCVSVFSLSIYLYITWMP